MRRSAYSARLVSEDTRALDRTECGKDRQEVIRRRGRWDGTNPERARRLRLKIEVRRTGLSIRRARVHEAGGVRGWRGFGCETIWW